jgi:hypothetical protein
MSFVERTHLSCPWCGEALPGFYSAVDGCFVYEENEEFLEVYLASGFVFVLRPKPSDQYIRDLGVMHSCDHFQG